MSATKPKANEAGEQQEDSQGKSQKGKHNDGAADLEKVTDFVEEQEISTQDIQKTMKMVFSRKQEQAMQVAAHEREISKVKVCQEDIDLVVNETGVSRAVAERKLKEHNGDMVQAMLDLLN